MITGIVKCTDITQPTIVNPLPITPLNYRGDVCNCVDDTTAKAIYISVEPAGRLEYQTFGDRTATLNKSYVLNIVYYAD